MSMRMRRGGTTVGGAPPPSGFGPLPDAQTIRDGAKPNVVADPGGGITFTSRLTLQNAITANPANSKFVAAGNTIYNWDADINDNGKHPRIYFLGDPATCIINGNGREGSFNNPSAGGGEVHGGTFKNFGTSTDAGQGIRMNTGWLVEDVISENNFGRGISTGADSGAITIRRAIIRNNGRYGLTMSQNTLGVWGPEGCLVEDVEISGNNTRHLGIGSDSGGTKFSSGIRNSTWRRIWAHDNYGSGLWWDAYHSGITVEDPDEVEAGVQSSSPFPGRRE